MKGEPRGASLSAAAAAASCVAGAAVAIVGSAACGRGPDPAGTSSSTVRGGAESSESAAGGSSASGAELRDEAGFVDVPAQASGSPAAARMFYVFEAADADPAGKPLAVFMAGGPGYPSSLELLPYGTARTTLGSPTSDGGLAANPASWTSFANLLFVDERQTGFSYEIGDGAAPAGATTCAFDPIGDASDFTRTILAFLDGHPALRGAPVVLVGQSYGGERATWILDLLLRYGTEAVKADAALGATIQAHYDAVFPREAGTVVDPSLAVTQFGWVVLLQPFVLGGLQYAEQATLMPSDPYVGAVPSGRDPYDVRQPIGWSQELDDLPATALADFTSAARLLTVDPRSIPRMAPATRAGAFRVGDGGDGAVAETNAAWTAAIGTLAPNDRYLVCPATACPTDASLFAGTGSQDAFVANLQAGVRTFVSDARYDSSIYAPAIPAALAMTAAVTVDSAPRSGVARPGWFTVAFAGDAGAPVEVRFPPYDDSGHFVALAEPQALHDDVEGWLAGGP